MCPINKTGKFLDKSMDVQTFNAWKKRIQNGEWLNVKECKSLQDINKIGIKRRRRGRPPKVKDNHDIENGKINYYLTDLFEMNDIRITDIELKRCNQDNDLIYQTFKGFSKFWRGTKFESEYLIVAVVLNKEYIHHWLYLDNLLWNKGCPALYNDKMEINNNNKKFNQIIMSFERRLRSKIDGSWRGLKKRH